MNTEHYIVISHSSHYRVTLPLMCASLLLRPVFLCSYSCFGCLTLPLAILDLIKQLLIEIECSCNVIELRNVYRETVGMCFWYCWENVNDGKTLVYLLVKITKTPLIRFWLSNSQISFEISIPNFHRFHLEFPSIPSI